MSDEAALRRAHEAGDCAALAEIYADHGFSMVERDLDAACFYLSFAYVFALEAEHERLGEVREVLARHGRV